jgi:2-polyprenyl-3-methyl-5-hydroxy-6-metoxy-1,4-benzoquinol methylase
MEVKKLNSGERQVGKDINEIDKTHVDRYMEVTKYTNEKKVLDLGCGCGYGSNLISLNAKSVDAIDNCREAIEYAKENWNNDNIKYINSDVIKINKNKKYDVVVALEIIEHIKDYILLLNKLASITKEKIIISVPHSTQPISVSKWHFKHFQIGELNNILEGLDFTIDYIQLRGRVGARYVYCVATKNKSNDIKKVKNKSKKK